MGSPPDAEFVQEYLLPLRAHRLDLPLARLPRWGVLSGKSPCTLPPLAAVLRAAPIY